jgi:hypothetical protein
MLLKKQYKIAFCGIITALGTVIMFLTSLIPIATYALPALAGIFIIPVVAEINTKWGFAVFAATSLVSFFLAGDREALLLYILFFGYYPIIYAFLDRIKAKLIRMIVKMLIFNTAMVIEMLIAVKLLGIQMESIGNLGNYSVLVLFILYNIVFWIYDYALKGLINIYFQKFHYKLNKYLH